MADLSKLTDAELTSIANNDFSALSESTLRFLAGTPETPTEKPSAFDRGLGIAARAITPTAVGAGVGSYGGPLGTIAGSMIVPAADTLGSLINAAISPFTDKRLIPTSKGIQNLMTMAGVPAPPEEQTAPERVASAGLETLTSLGKQVPALSTLATSAQTPVGRALASKLAAEPATQAVVSPTAAMTGQTVYEATNNPIAAFITTLGTSLIGGLKRPTTQQAVSEEAMAKIAQDRYQTLDKMGVQLKTSEFVTDMQSAAKELRTEGYTPKAYPKVSAAIEELTSTTQPKDWVELQALRKMIRGAQKSTDPEEKRLASILLDKFDNYLTKVDISKVESGDAKLVAKTWAEARDAYSKMKKSEIFSDMLETAKIDKNKYTQSGAENALTAQLRLLAKNDKRMAMFSQEEQDAITKAAQGDTIQNSLRFFGKFAPTGVFTGGGAGSLIVYDPVTGIPLVAGSMAARAAATSRRMGTIDELGNQMRLGQTPQVTGEMTRSLPGLFGNPGLALLEQRRLREMSQEQNRSGLLSQ